MFVPFDNMFNPSMFCLCFCTYLPLKGTIFLFHSQVAQCTYCTAEVSFMRLKAQWRDVNNIKPLYFHFHLYWERQVRWRPPLAPSSVLSVSVWLLVWSALVSSTCVWHYCDKAAQPLWGDGECQRLEQRSEQLPNIWWNEKHTRWMAGLPTPQRGSSAEGGGQGKPQMCVWNITLPLFFPCSLPCISSQIPKNNI